MTRELLRLALLGTLCVMASSASGLRRRRLLRYGKDHAAETRADFENSPLLEDAFGSVFDDIDKAEDIFRNLAGSMSMPMPMTPALEKCVSSNRGSVCGGNCEIIGDNSGAICTDNGEICEIIGPKTYACGDMLGCAILDPQGSATSICAENLVCDYQSNDSECDDVKSLAELQEVIGASSQGGEIKLCGGFEWTSADECNVDGAITISSDLTLTCEREGTCIIGCQSPTFIVDVLESEQVVIGGLVLMSALHTPIRIDSGNLALSKMIFERNSISSGAVLENNGSVGICQSKFIQNISENGKGVVSNRGEMNIVSSDFIGNEVSALYNNEGRVDIVYSNFTDNKAIAGSITDGKGGAIYNALKSDLNVFGTIFKNNRAKEGGAIYNLGKADVVEPVFITNIQCNGIFEANLGRCETTPDGSGV